MFWSQFLAILREFVVLLVCAVYVSTYLAKVLHI
jgi:hypothetical protein